MCCILTTLFLLGPRFAVLVWWLFNPYRFSAAFTSFLWPILGIIFAPWTTLMYLLVWSPVTGIYGLDWAFLALAVVADVGMYIGIPQ